MILRTLAWVGRHGTGLLAGGFFIGILAPPLAALVHPYVAVAVFLLTTSTFLAADWRALLFHLRRPVRLILILVWTLLACPLLSFAAARALGLPAGLGQALVLWGASAPLAAVGAIAFLLGLDSALALLAMIFGTFIMPFTLPPLALGLLGVDLGLGVLALSQKLALFVGSAGLLALALGFLMGQQRLRRHAVELSGLNVVILQIFAIGVMDGMEARILADPATLTLYAATAFLGSVILQGVSFLAFSWLDRRSALTVGLIGGNHNLALVWANLGAKATPEITLFVAAVQVPLFIAPALLRPIYRRLARASKGVVVNESHRHRAEENPEIQQQ
ncbi:MAG TPA: hypothetical protein VKT70_10220 [Stellaceae bacterium]|nr:hypothetical protein [Stellaceae bacterium]